MGVISIQVIMEAVSLWDLGFESLELEIVGLLHDLVCGRVRVPPLHIESVFVDSVWNQLRPSRAGVGMCDNQNYFV